MKRFLPLFLLLMLLGSCDDFYDNHNLVHKEHGKKVKSIFYNGRPLLSVECQLLKSKVSVRSSQVIFNLELTPRNIEMFFVSKDSNIFLSDLGSTQKINVPVSSNSLPESGMQIVKKGKYKIYGSISELDLLNDNSTVIGLKLPPIVVGDERIELEIINFGFR